MNFACDIHDFKVSLCWVTPRGGNFQGLDVMATTLLDDMEDA